MARQGSGPLQTANDVHPTTPTRSTKLANISTPVTPMICVNRLRLLTSTATAAGDSSSESSDSSSSSCSTTTRGRRRFRRRPSPVPTTSIQRTHCQYLQSGAVHVTVSVRSSTEIFPNDKQRHHDDNDNDDDSSMSSLSCCDSEYDWDSEDEEFVCLVPIQG